MTITDIVHHPTCHPSIAWGDKSQKRKRLSNINEIEAEFGIMVTKVQAALEKSNVSVHQLLIKLKSSSAVRDRKVPLFDPGIFEKVTSIDKLFETLSGYWHLFDYEVLRHLIDTAECEAAKMVYDEFLASFDSSVISNCNHQLILSYHEFNEGKVLPGTCRLWVKIAKDECTGETEREVKKVISEYFKYALILKGIKQGCIEVVYHISPSVKSYILQYKVNVYDILQLKAHKLRITALKVDDVIVMECTGLWHKLHNYYLSNFL